MGLTRSGSTAKMLNLHEQQAELEDDLIEMKMRFDVLEEMDEEDPAFDEDEYDNLEESIEVKEKMLDELRS